MSSWIERSFSSFIVSRWLKFCVIIANVKCASEMFAVLRSTLGRRVTNESKNIHGSSKGLGRFRATFDETLDCEQVGHLKLLESRLFGLTYTELRQLAYQLA